MLTGIGGCAELERHRLSRVEAWSRTVLRHVRNVSLAQSLGDVASLSPTSPIALSEPGAPSTKLCCIIGIREDNLDELSRCDVQLGLVVRS